MKIYVDVFFFLDFAIDFICLYATEKVLSLPLSVFRLTIGALLGGVWGVIFLLFPTLDLLHIPMVFIIAYICSCGRKIFATAVVFILSEALMGGIILSLLSLFAFLPRNGIRFGGVIILCAVFILTFEKIYELCIRKKLLTASVTATVSHNNKTRKVCLMIDSGNLARESTTGRRIIFIKESSILNLTDGGKNEKIFAIPIKTASGSSIKYGFIPDNLEFNIKKYNKREFIVVPDISGCEFGGYDGIIGVI